MWRALFTYSTVEGFFKKEINEMDHIKITDLGRKFISDSFDFFISRDNDYSKIKKVKNNFSKTSVLDEPLLRKLISLRKDIAKRQSLPPYVILQEFSLEDMTLKYPITLEEFKNINGIGDGKVLKFGNEFIKLIKNHIEENQIYKPEEIILRTKGLKSSKKLSLIQNIDKKIPLDEISESRGISFDELLSELESIVFSGTKLNIDYYVDEMLDEDQQNDLKEYFMESESEKIENAAEEFDGEFEEEELRVYRIKFISDVSN